MRVLWRTDNPDLIVGIAEARAVHVQAASPGLEAALAVLLARRREPGFPPDPLRRAIRDVLRHGGFKPTGRNKPASEYLARAAAAGTFPRINNVVDACNLHSLETGYPISLLDLDRALPEDGDLEIRNGREGETYVFNPAGQSIDVSGLVLLARAGGSAVGNAVKDSMATKTCEETSNVLAVLYASRRLADAEEVLRTTEALAARLGRFAGASETRAWILPESGP
ncbi:MAG: phenylalanine--tRNA ligase beta subunit-related protein [Planctomycetota bacterium]|jgi:DNA/RNA-binding domain of Phe-tRNA-synthetase-like protein